MTQPRTPQEILADVANQYDLAPHQVLARIYGAKSVYMSSRAYVRALQAEYPDAAENWIARHAKRHRMSVRRMLRDDTPDVREDLRRVSSWGDRDSERLVELVQDGLSGQEICAAFGIPYPAERNTVYCEISRLVESRRLRKGRLGFPRRPVDTPTGIPDQPGSRLYGQDRTESGSV